MHMHFEVTEKDFSNFSKLIYAKCGINLHNGKRELLKARLAKILRNSDFTSVKDYYRYLTEKASDQEIIPLLDTISTNLTSFFRESRHFEFLSDTAIPELLKRRGSKKLNVWCAACSSGEEAYSIAITLLESVRDSQLWDVNVLATDISTRMLNTAKQGIYDKDRVGKIPHQLQRAYFKKGIRKWQGFYRVKPQLQKIIKFERFNLMEPLPSNHTFDVIFLRNVMIYFDKPTQEKLVNKCYDNIEKDGYFFIGHSESLTGVNHKFKYIKPSVYRK